MNSTLGTADLVSRSNYSDALSSLPRGRCLGSVPFSTDTWHVTLELERTVDAYLSSKSLADQVALAKLMSECESSVPVATIVLPRIIVPGPTRSRTSTDPVPFLKQPGAGRILAAQWWAELEARR